MTQRNLKDFLTFNLNGNRAHAVAVNQEILDCILPGFSLAQLNGKEIMVYEFDGTAIFMSDGGLARPRQIIFFRSDERDVLYTRNRRLKSRVPRQEQRSLL